MVEWKKIGEVCKTITPPKKLVKELYNSYGLYPIIDQGQKEFVGFTDDESAIVPKNDYILFGDHTRFVKYHKGQFAQGADGLKILTTIDGVLPRYFFHAFSNTEVPSRGYSRHWSIAKELLIPILPLSEQKRISGILDTFTASIDNLKNQINNRHKQFEYYRSLFLNLKGIEDVEIRSLSEVCKIIRGIRVVKKNLKENDTFPVYQNSLKPLGYYDKYNTTSNTPFVIIGGAAGDIGYSSIPFWAADDCLCICSEKGILGKYVYHWLISYQYLIKSQVRIAGVPRLSRSVIDNFEIAVPSISEQTRIVRILDTFEASIKNLEAQLELRQKQYEYYRNKLLTF